MLTFSRVQSSKLRNIGEIEYVYKLVTGKALTPVLTLNGLYKYSIDKQKILRYGKPTFTIQKV